MTMPNMSSEETALAGLARARMKACVDETFASEGPITAKMQGRGIIAAPGREAMFEYFFWDGIRTGLRAAHDPAVLESLMNHGLDSLRS